MFLGTCVFLFMSGRDIAERQDRIEIQERDTCYPGIVDDGLSRRYKEGIRMVSFC